MGSECSRKHSFAVGAFVLCAVFLAVLASEKTAGATANWSRKYALSCNSCHEPAVPRLNRKGHIFRKLGFRMPEEVGQKQEYKEIGEYLALRLRPRYTYTDPDVAGVSTDHEFRVNDATVFYNGAVTEALSINVELEYDNLATFNGFGSLMWLVGTPERNWRFRVGQMHTVPRVGFGVFDRPTGIGTTDIINARLTASPVPFSLSTTRQRGLEVAYSHDESGRIIAQVLNGLDPAGRADRTDVDNDRDFILAYERLLGPHGSSFTIYGYDGTWHQQRVDPLAVVPVAIDDTLDEFSFLRYGVTGNVVIPTAGKPWELLAGVIWGEDEFPSAHVGPGAPRPGATVDANAWMVEVQKWLPHDAAVFARYDNVGEDIDTEKVSLGVVGNANDHLRLGLEAYQTISSPTGIEPLGAILEAMFNF